MHATDMVQSQFSNKERSIQKLNQEQATLKFKHRVKTYSSHGEKTDILLQYHHKHHGEVWGTDTRSLAENNSLTHVNVQLQVNSNNNCIQQFRFKLENGIQSFTGGQKQKDCLSV